MSGQTLELMKTTFGSNKVPKLLEELCNYWDENPQFFCGSFEIQADQWEMAKAWFKDQEKGYSRIKGIGIDGIGSLYALWIYEGRTSDNAPVVFLSSEGEGNTVIADSMKDFLQYLTSNRDYDCFQPGFAEFEESSREGNEKYKKWLKQKFKIEPIEDPSELWENAKKNHPDFQSWIDEVRT